MLVNSWPEEFAAGISSTLLRTFDPPRFHAADNLVRVVASLKKIYYFSDDTLLDFIKFRLCNEIFGVTAV